MAARVRLTGDFFEHVTGPGERWDLIAYRYYGDQYKQTVLLEANRHMWLDELGTPPAILAPGTVLRVPVIEEEAGDAALPPWKRAAPDYGAAR